ncbi:MAG: hypothetical protein L0Y72_28565 [Gemmataceae bacterium]|nr:hypothetical protein [Gemmataceae bacterium]MCI0743002.1 hypothetical protein [Gemmataceae bacterium]
MYRTWVGKLLVVLGLATAGQASAQGFLNFGLASRCGPANCVPCQRFHCPPPLKWCQERPPRICFQHGCPRPVCDPCQHPHWGYFQTCWTPWPWPPDWSHCPVQPPASVVFPGVIPPGGTGAFGAEQTPTPRPVELRPPL